MNLLQQTVPLFTASLALAQAWGVTDSTPTAVAQICYDPFHQRAVGCTVFPVAAWSFDGVSWRHPSPDGLEGSLPILAGYDPARRQCLVVVQDFATRRNVTFVSRGAGFERQFQFQGVPGYGASCAFDPIGNRLIAFGGEDATGQPTDTMYAWNGVWVQLQPASRPSPRSQAGMALDPVRGRVVLFGGSVPTNSLADTWEWNGSQWIAITPTAAPPARSGPLAFDPTTQQVVLLGGYAVGAGALTDCWTWNGSQWSPRGMLPSSSAVVGYHDGAHLFVVESNLRANVWRANGASWIPVWTDPSMPYQSLTAIAHDPARDEILLTGGSGGGTWAWNGSWQRRSTSTPGARVGTAMAPIGSQMLLFGGMQAPIQIIADTWTWNGAVWTMQFPAVQPPARTQHAMAAVGNRVLLFGGSGGSTVYDDTWQFDGVTWSQLLPVTSPVARWGHGLAHDPIRQRTVLYGGYNSATQFGDTWEWDGTNWQQRMPAHAPNSLGTQLVFDSTTARVVLPQINAVWSFDGLDWTPGPATDNGDALNSTFAYHQGRQRLVGYGFTGITQAYGPTPSTAELSLATCGNRPDLRLLDRPAIGTTPLLHVEAATSALAIVAFGLQPANVIWSGCVQEITIVTTFAGLLDVRGQLSIPFAIPSALGFRGVQVLAQAVVLDGGPVFGASLTGALRISIGD